MPYQEYEFRRMLMEYYKGTISPNDSKKLLEYILEKGLDLKHQGIKDQVYRFLIPVGRI